MNVNNLKYIYYTEKYKNSLPPEINSDNKKLYENLLTNDIPNYIDIEKVKNNYDTGLHTITEEKFFIKNKFIFAQIKGIQNIAISTESSKLKDYDNLDEIDEEVQENKYLQGEEKTSEKTEKIIYKFALTTTGQDEFYGYENKSFNSNTIEAIQNITKDSKIKVLLGPDIEVRRGLYYLNSSNFKILT